MSLEAIKYKDGKLEILDQLRLPGEHEYVQVLTKEDAWSVINKMQVRGSHAIAIVGYLTVASHFRRNLPDTTEDLMKDLKEHFDFLVTARPTAVNISDARSKAYHLAKEHLMHFPVEEATEKMIEWLESHMTTDVLTNRKLSEFGGRRLVDLCSASWGSMWSHEDRDTRKLRVLTHCNTGSLATFGWGTALGVARWLQAEEFLERVYTTETRPYLQGARLTAYELVHDNIPGTLIADSMAACAIKHFDIDAIIVGADRIASNGDTANKVGTYQLAIVAQSLSIPFMVAAPVAAFDFELQSGAEIEIEERPAHELTDIAGIPIAAKGIDVWNPAFDVTPGNLVTGGFATEYGLFMADELQTKLLTILTCESNDD